MDPLVALIQGLYKIAGLLTGTIFGWLGYRLFSKSIWGDSGTFRASYKDTKLLLKGGAPGTFFVLCGASIIAITLYRGLELSYDDTASTNEDVRVLTTPNVPLPQPSTQPK
jgi:hypothetical protein